jgi:hypothetical protein
MDSEQQQRQQDRVRRTPCEMLEQRLAEMSRRNGGDVQEPGHAVDRTEWMKRRKLHENMIDLLTNPERETELAEFYVWQAQQHKIKKFEKKQRKGMLEGKETVRKKVERESMERKQADDEAKRAARRSADLKAIREAMRTRDPSVRFKSDGSNSSSRSPVLSL